MSDTTEGIERALVAWEGAAVKSRYPCRVLSLTNQETASMEQRIREHLTGDAWEYYTCVDNHWHVQQVRR